MINICIIYCTYIYILHIIFIYKYLRTLGLSTFYLDPKYVFTLSVSLSFTVR